MSYDSSSGPLGDSGIFPGRSIDQIKSILDSDPSCLAPVKRFIDRLSKKSPADGSTVVVLIPGVMGSMLDATDDKGTIVQWLTLGTLKSVWTQAELGAATPERDTTDGFCGTVHPPDKAGLGPPLLPADPLTLSILTHSIAPYKEVMAPAPDGLGAVPFTYDWRQDLRLTACLLFFALRAAHERFKCNFHIVTHSMGGLVASYMLGRFSGPELESLVKRVVFVAPPFRGAVGALRVVEYGLLGNGLDWATWFYGVTNLVRERSLSFPGCLQLISAQQSVWMRGLNHIKVALKEAGHLDKANDVAKVLPPIRTETHGSEDDAAWVNRYAEDGSSTAKWLRSCTEVFHDDCDKIRDWIGQSAVWKSRVAVIAGFDAVTDLAATEFTANGQKAFSFGHTELRPNGYFNGDGAVLVQSAVIKDVPIYCVRGTDKVVGRPDPGFWDKITFQDPRHTDFHQSILKLSHVLTLVSALFNGASIPPANDRWVSLGEAANLIDWTHEHEEWTPKKVGTGYYGLAASAEPSDQEKETTAMYIKHLAEHDYVALDDLLHKEKNRLASSNDATASRSLFQSFFPQSDPTPDAVKEFDAHVDFVHRQAQLLKALDQATQVAKQFQPPIHTMAEWCVANPSQAKEELQRQLTAVGIHEELTDYDFIQCVSLQQADLARQQVE